jgi:type IV secretory pathway VirD2 relaxase
MQTIDNTAVTPEAAKKRGRPSTGAALSAAERQARRRAKLEAEGKALLPPVVVSQEVEKALATYIQFKDMTLGDAIERIVRHRLLRKRSGKRKPRPDTRSSASRAGNTKTTTSIGAGAPSENN